MKRKFFTSVMIFLVAFTLSFTTAFGESLSQQEANNDPGTQAAEAAQNTEENPTETTEAVSTGTDNQSGSAAPAPSLKTTGPEGDNEKKDQQEPVYAPLVYDTAALGLKAALTGNKDNSRSLTWGRPLPYSATMTSMDGAPAPTAGSMDYALSNTYKTPAAEAALAFGTITFSKPGTYTYIVKQVILQKDLFGVYDTGEKTVTITVSAKAGGDANEPAQLEVTNVIGSQAVFGNSYNDIDRPFSIMTKPTVTNTGKTKLPGGFKHANVYQCEARSKETGMYIVWYTVSHAKGYIIYKRSGTSGKWHRIGTVDGYMHISYRDRKVKNGCYYQYKVIAKTRRTSRKPSLKASDNTGIMGNYFLSKPEVKDSGSVIRWKTNPKADGMRIEVSKNKVFIGARTYMVPNGTNSFNVPEYGTSYGSYRYVRVMPYKAFDNNYHYGLPWLNKQTYKNMTSTVEFIVKDEYKDKAASLQKNHKYFKEMLSMAGQKMWGYDTTQGITFDGKYAYMNVENRYANSIKVIKMDTTDNFRVVQVSKPIRHCHGNDITYNSDTNRLYITYSYFNKRYVARMHPDNLKYLGRNHIKVPYKVAGPHGHVAIRNLNCYNEIHYDNVKKQYLLKKKESHSMVVLDKNFKVIRYMRIKERVEITNQNMMGTPEFFMRVQSNYQSNHKNNYVTVFDWHGTGITHFRLKFGALGKAELENIFFIGDQMYGACYKKWWDKRPVGSKVKEDKVKRHGKWVFKYRKVTKKNQNKQSGRQLRRTSYIFKINLFG